MYRQINKRERMRRRRKPLAALAALLAAGVIGLLLIFPGTALAAGAEETGSLTILYRDLDGENVAGAEFSLRLVGEPLWDGSFQSLVGKSLDADTDPETVSADASGLPVRKMTTGADGVLRFDGLKAGLYLVEETLPAENHFPSVSFFAAIPAMGDGKWLFDVTAEPKPLASGSLRVSKRVEGAGGDRERAFRFRISLEAEGEFPVLYSRGETGTIRDGDVLSLRHGEYAEISSLPAGTAYEVEELDAGRDGYRAEMSGEKGNVAAKTLAEAAFVNYRGGTPTPQSTPTPPPGTTPTPPSGPTPTPPPAYPPQTGDTSEPKPYLAMAALSFMIMAGVFISRLCGKK